jgi:2-polyprenyl-3-methyl-5-hydroxy-6-metoxy-1,4-benzoquinol methylase
MKISPTSGLLEVQPEMPLSSSSRSLHGEVRVDPCPCCFLCGKGGQELYAGLEDWLFSAPGSWGMRSCAACGVIWLDPQPAVEDIPKLYWRYYTHRSPATTPLETLRRATWQCVIGRMGYEVDQPKQLLPRMLSRIPSIRKAGALEVMDIPASPVGTLLDVGCGNGEFIKRMQSFGWKVSGVDPDPAAVQWGKQQGLEVFQGMVSDVPAGANYDVITLSHVLEHVPDPVELLRECRRRLRPLTGTVILTTPNINSLGHRWFREYWRGLEVPRHLRIFSRDALIACIARSGLRLQTIRTETRLARMIYAPSICAKRGKRSVGDLVSLGLGAKCASYAFQLLEDAMIGFQKDIGEEIYCACMAAAENDGNGE